MGLDLQMTRHLSKQRLQLRRVYHQYAFTRYGYSVLAHTQAGALILFVFSNWRVNHADDAPGASLWTTIGGHAFNVWGVTWLTAIVLASGHYVYVRKQDDDTGRQVARLINGFIFFPPFIAVVGYFPVYVLIGWIARILAHVD